MLNEQQTQRMLQKLQRYEKTLEPYFFLKMDTVSFAKYETVERLHTVPDKALFTPIKDGDLWGQEGGYVWLAAEYTVPKSLTKETLFLRPHSGGYESMLWVDGMPCGIFANKILVDTHGNHYCDLLCSNVKPGSTIDIALQSYAGHYVIGTMPFSEDPKPSFTCAYHDADICIKQQDVIDFAFDLHTLNQLCEVLDTTSFRRAQIINCLRSVFDTVSLSPTDCNEKEWRHALQCARKVMQPVLSQPNSAAAPMAGLVGHSHMDTAWLWPIEETIEKCARTFSNQLRLMEQYQEYQFIQSSAYHTELMRRYYPTLFEKIKEKVAQGRYEMNGGVWIECDCNIPSGESMVRQFLWGQRYNQQHFNCMSDCFWLPDTFGYSAALPQIMQGCGVHYFYTTKLSWNDTNRSPYETFYWQGIDGTCVLTHFNVTHCATDPKALLSHITGDSANCLQDKTISNKRLIAYGYGDGGGGPQFEHLEMARRVADTDGCPKAAHTTISDFMKSLEKTAQNVPLHTGELYLELHRGTLTNQHLIKKNNRDAEKMLHNLELFTVQNAVQAGAMASEQKLRPLWETLLVNQFHDILPGTCIAQAHDRSYKEMGELLEDGDRLQKNLLPCDSKRKTVTFLNTLSREYCGQVILNESYDSFHFSVPTQTFTALDASKQKAVFIKSIPAFGSTEMTSGHPDDLPKSSFDYKNSILETPFAVVRFTETGTIASFYDKRAQRELRGNGLPLNTFLFGEDVCAMWDSWDIDADLKNKLHPCVNLLDREIVSDGCLQFRIRSTYQLSAKSVLRQDMVFYADTPRIDFETMLDWNDKHRFLKVDFNLAIYSEYVRNEIQFGHCIRKTTRNTSQEQAMFEVVNHKYTDISETRYGVALLNDCKYGISAEGSSLQLSLHKGGTRPDPRGDAGVHTFRYALLPHMGGFSAESVVWPAYEFNNLPVAMCGERPLLQLVTATKSNIIIETVKPCEEEQSAFILRLYECEGTYTRTQMKFNPSVTALESTDMLEQNGQPMKLNDVIAFKPFEIKTLKCTYRQTEKTL